MKLKTLIIALCLALSLWPAATFAAFDPNSPATGHNIHSDVTATRTNFNALRSCESSATEPSNLVAGMFWYDTTANILKLRNEANSAWQSVWDFGNNRLPLNVLAPGELTADTGGRAKMADLFITDAKVNDVAGSKLTGNAPTNFVTTAGITAANVTPPKLSSGMVLVSEPDTTTEYSTTSDSYVTVCTYRVLIPTGTVNMRWHGRVKGVTGYTNYARLSVGGVTGAEITSTASTYDWTQSSSLDVSSVAGTNVYLSIQLHKGVSGPSCLQGYTVFFY